MNKGLLKKRLEEAPRMEPQDAVKLAFQSAFGCGHLMPSHEQGVAMLESELAQTPVRPVPACTPIGNGLCRLNLASAEVRELGAEMIWRMMLATEKRVAAREGNERRYGETVRLMGELAQGGEAPFSAKALETYLEAYHAQGLRPVSHTPCYREAYQPAYRVVLEDCALLLPVIKRLEEGCALAVFDGPCGSGKTTLGTLLAEMYETQPIPMDDFFLPPEMRTPERLREPGGNVHRERFAEEVLSRLPQERRWQRFDCGSFEMHERSLPWARITVIEGSYSHHPSFAKAYERLGALRVFVDVEEREQLRRIAKRDPELVSMFQSRWIPLEKNYFQAYDIRSGADVIIQSPASGEERAR